MVFSSLLFLFVFLPVVLGVSYILPRRARNLFLLIANLVFYAYGEPVYVLLMAASIAVNYAFGIFIERAKKQGIKRLLLTIAVVLNIGALCYFKYTNLIVETLRKISLFSDMGFYDIALPIGISFYTFQAVSYIIDVYRGECKASYNIINFASYISLFPQLIAGPIVRYTDIADRLNKREIRLSDFADGVRMFVIGLGKKVLLANQFGIIWNSVSSDTASAGTAGAWLGAAAFTLQIYFDFGGYSDMAIGLGKMLGFDFCVNFNFPYISKSVTEFWRRWHISLSTWFKDYVYIPLGGNRVGKLRLCFNILVVWMLTGLWHGAGWNFLVWGFYYGVILLAEKLILGKYIKKLPAVFQHIYTMLIVIIGWVFFASDNIGGAVNYLSLMFKPRAGGLNLIWPWIITLIFGVVFSTPFIKNIAGKIKDKKIAAFIEPVIYAVILVLCTASLISDSYNPFLYFRF